MGKLLYSFVFPHPPILLPDIGKGKENEAAATLKALESCTDLIGALNPDTIILTTPHGPIFSDYVFMSEQPTLNGSFENFGHVEINFSFSNNISLVNEIKKSANAKNIFCGDLTDDQYREFNIKKGLDHGALVPLYFIKKKLSSFNLVHLSVADFSNIELYTFGIAIQEAIKNTEGTFVFIASGDLSHKFSHESPYGFSQKGPEFDHQLMNCFEKDDVLGILNMEDSLCQEAAECGMKSFIIMLGANNEMDLSMKVLSHEGPFGIGYGVVSLHPGKENKNRDFLSIIKSAYKTKARTAQTSGDSYVQLAQLSLEYYLHNHRGISLEDVPTMLQLPAELLTRKAGVFVSIKKHGQLRGCIGTIRSTKNSIAEEILENAISAGTRDPRFNAISLSEFEDLVFSVDILSEAEPIADASFLDVKKYGVIVESGYRRGLLLPNLEGVDTVDEQVKIALSKAGIQADENYSMERFEVIRHK